MAVAKICNCFSFKPNFSYDSRMRGSNTRSLGNKIRDAQDSNNTEAMDDDNASSTDCVAKITLTLRFRKLFNQSRMRDANKGLSKNNQASSSTSNVGTPVKCRSNR